MDLYRITADGFYMILPELILTAGACLLFLTAALAAGCKCSQSSIYRHACAATALVVFLVAVGFWIASAGSPPSFDKASFFRNDGMGWLVKGMGLFAGSMLTLISWNKIPSRYAAEYFGSLILMITGVNLTAVANDLVALFLALELVSIPTYVLLYLPKSDAKAQEAVTKYFLLSVFSSGLFLYGLSLLYGVTGDTNLEAVRQVLAQDGASPMPGLLVIALLMLVASLGSRVAAVPFHFYAPDVFQGVTVVGAAMLSYVPKIVGFVAMIRLITDTLMLEHAADGTLTLSNEATPFIILIAVATMSLGNFAALAQTNIRRLLAYSSIAHAGYMMVGIAAGRSALDAVNGMESVLFYLTTYGAMTLGAFAILSYLSSSERTVESVDDLAGLGQTHPIAAFILATCFFSFIGLPPTAGLWGKFYILMAAWFQGSLWLKAAALILVLNAAVGGWYYLRVIATIYLADCKEPLPKSRDVPSFAAAVLCGALTLGLFITPGSVFHLVERASDPTPATISEPIADNGVANSLVIDVQQ